MRRGFQQPPLPVWPRPLSTMECSSDTSGFPDGPRQRRNPENRDLEASSWGPPHDEPFRATRQHSTTRGEAPFQPLRSPKRHPCEGGGEV